MLHARYNRIVKPASCLIAAALLLAGCGKSNNNTEALKAGLMKDLASKVDVNNMDVTLTDAKFNGDEAEVNVTFAAKGQPGGGGMAMKYQMARKEDGWHIVRRNGNASAHGGGVAPGAAASGEPQAGHGSMENMPMPKSSAEQPIKQ